MLRSRPSFRGRKAQQPQRGWTDTRVIIFTEYADTLRWLHSLLAQAIEGTDDADGRITRLQGGMSDEQRAEVQRAFNGSPTDNPVRILLATDSAREGVNLQAQCADLFHFDIPWNPARMEQRNGRIDRTMQPSSEVRCHYFVYADRKEDAVLDTLVRKVDMIQRELGSLGTVVLDRVTGPEGGIDGSRTASSIEKAAAIGEKAEISRRELESQRDAKRLQEEITDIGKILADSKRALEFDPALLRGAIDAGLELSNVGGEVLRAEASRESGAPAEFRLPALPDSWKSTLDGLRPARRRDESDVDWRKRPLLPMVFEPPERIDDEIVHMHLEHPFVERILSRFRAQGFGAHDLSRVTVLLSKRDSVPRAIAFGRLTLFGRTAARLHDAIIAVAAPGSTTHAKVTYARFRRRRITKQLSISRNCSLHTRLYAVCQVLSQANFALLRPATSQRCGHPLRMKLTRVQQMRFASCRNAQQRKPRR
ncbi:MAG: SWF/SNF helicase family protein [Sandaracinaceae bacterium]|nr:SWF/SNF helicase family protein [Sandaracinaceae bacterium]